MCIIIDTNCLASVIKSKSADHEEFKPILDWVIDGTGSFVIGGTKYLKEIKGYLGLLSELAKVNKVINISQQKVDEKENWAAAQIQHPDFDDPHIVALLMISGCKLICSLDERAYPFFKHEMFFSPANKRPKIYNQKGNANLLINANIAKCCTARKLKVNEKEALIFLNKNS